MFEATKFSAVPTMSGPPKIGLTGKQPGRDGAKMACAVQPALLAMALGDVLGVEEAISLIRHTAQYAPKWKEHNT